MIRENDELFFVVRVPEMNLYEVMKKRERHFPVGEKQDKERHVSDLPGPGLHAQARLLPWDIKPENMLVKGDHVQGRRCSGGALDLRLAAARMHYVSTRWYVTLQVLLIRELPARRSTTKPAACKTDP